MVEVWDFDPAETIGEKMTKVFDVKGVKGFKKLMKEIAVTASTGKHDNELIGRSNIPLGVSYNDKHTFSKRNFSIYLFVSPSDDPRIRSGHVVQPRQEKQIEAPRFDQNSIDIQC